MSVEAVAAAFKLKLPNAVDKLVLLSMADHHNRSTGLCCPKIKTIMEDATKSRATVFRSLSRLERQKLIRSTAQYDDNGRQTSSKYELIFIGSQVETVGGRVSDCDPRGSHSYETGGSLNCDTPLKKTGISNGNNNSIKAKADALANKRSAKAEEVRAPKDGNHQENGGAKPTTAKRKRGAYPADFEVFFASYRRKADGMQGSKAEAAAEWKKLDEDEKASALAAIDAYAKQTQSQRLSMKHAVRYLRHSVFADFTATVGEERDRQIKALALDMVAMENGDINRDELRYAKDFWASFSDVPRMVVDAARSLISSWNTGPVGAYT